VFFPWMAAFALAFGASAPAHQSVAVHASPLAACSASLTAAEGSAASKTVRITVAYDEADIRNVLAAFAKYSGRTINVGKDVAGNVTTEIHDQAWDAALQSILTPMKLAACQSQNGTIAVDTVR
jgi:type IV pilus assembly protein PilQ